MPLLEIASEYLWRSLLIITLEVPLHEKEDQHLFLEYEFSRTLYLPESTLHNTPPED